MSQEKTRIGIVGLGPKGLYGLERLLANLQQAEIPIPVEIHLFNKSDSFGAGDIYNPSQPSFLKMNYVNGYINMWPETLPKPSVPDPKSYVEWLDDHREEFPNASETTFSSRATVGRYLSDGFEALIDNCPAQVSIIKHVGEVEKVLNERDAFSVIYESLHKSESIEIQNLSQLLVATGHPCVNDDSLTQLENHIDFIYPVEKKLKSILPGSKIAMKGMGLTFIDAALALTEGRGGTFLNEKNGKIKYVKSGLEPEKMYPFSNSGMPIIPRGNTFGKTSIVPFYFTRESVHKLSQNQGKLDFEQDLLPLIIQDFKVVYYSRLFANHGLEFLLSPNFSKVEIEIEKFHKQYPDQPKFDFHEFLEGSISEENLNQNTLEWIQMSIQEAELGIENSAFAAVEDTWRHLSDTFNDLYCFGGLNPSSQEKFLKAYSGCLNRITYGPPIENMKKIEALAKADLIDFSFSQNPEVLTSDNEIQLKSSHDNIQVDFLVDARIPRVNLNHCAGPLYQSMLDQDLIVPFTNKLDGHPDFSPGCLAINRKGQAIDSTGKTNERITFTGTPTEGMTYDNDSLSRKRNDFVSIWAKTLVQKLLQKEAQLQY